jgi:hypothetical protein
MVINHIIEDLDTNEHIIEQVKKIIGYCAYKSACHSEYHRYLTYFNKALNFLTYCVLLINISVVFSMNNLVSPYVATIIIATVNLINGFIEIISNTMELNNKITKHNISAVGYKNLQWFILDWAMSDIYTNNNCIGELSNEKILKSLVELSIKFINNLKSESLDVPEFIREQNKHKKQNISIQKYVDSTESPSDVKDVKLSDSPSDIKQTELNTIKVTVVENTDMNV